MIIFYFNDGQHEKDDLKELISILKESSNQDIRKKDNDIHEKQVNENEDTDLKNNNFQYNIRHLRKQKGLTQEQLSKEIDIAPITIRFYESGKREPTGKNLCLIANYFKVNPVDLMGTGND